MTNSEQTHTVECSIHANGVTGHIKDMYSPYYGWHVTVIKEHEELRVQSIDTLYLVKAQYSGATFTVQPELLITVRHSQIQIESERVPQ